MPHSRRDFLKLVGTSSLLVCMPLRSNAIPTAIMPAPRPPLPLKEPVNKPARFISCYNTHTGESLKKIVFWNNGLYDKEAVKAINHLFRDHRNNKEHPIDPKLLDLLDKLRRLLDTEEQFNLISGYRSPHSNKQLCDKSTGVARNSQHLYGKAADIAVKGRTISQITRAALSLKSGGVGGYRHFVHIDTGRVRRWGKNTSVNNSLRVV